MHRSCAGFRLLPPGRHHTRCKRARRAIPLGLPGLIRVAVLSALGLSLLLAGCASPGVQAAAESRGWERCNGSRPANLTFLCLQR